MKINLVQTSVSHFGLEIGPTNGTNFNNMKPVTDSKTINEEMLMVANVGELEKCLLTLPEDEHLEKKLRHLHRQFGHPMEETWNKFVKRVRLGFGQTKRRKLCINPTRAVKFARCL